MPPSYNPKEVEDSWHAWWETQVRLYDCDTPRAHSAL